jgi:hypothetical protein
MISNSMIKYWLLTIGIILNSLSGCKKEPAVVINDPNYSIGLVHAYGFGLPNSSSYIQYEILVNGQKY